MVGIAMMAITGMLVIFVICPIIIFHYLTKLWKSRSLSSDDEQALQQLFLTAQKLEDRLINLERVLDIDGNVRK